MTAQEYLELERLAPTKSEFHDGSMFAMAGASKQHVRITTNLTVHLGGQLSGGPCEPFVADMRVAVERTGLYTYPEIAVVCGEAQFLDDQNDTLLNSTVLFEVLSRSTESYDRGRKFAHYRQIESLQAYVLVAQDEPLVECFIRQGEIWALTDFRGLDATLRVEPIGVAIPLRDIYARVEFPPPESLDPPRDKRGQ
jgi:Uma2 family endonuclease